jgi:hypothetical protein
MTTFGQLLVTHCHPEEDDHSVNFLLTQRFPAGRHMSTVSASEDGPCYSMISLREMILHF